TEDSETLPSPVDLAERDRFVLAGEVIVECAQRYARPVGDVFAGDVLQPTLEGEFEGGIAECPAGAELLTLTQPHRSGHAARLAKTCLVCKIARRANCRQEFAKRPDARCHHQHTGGSHETTNGRPRRRGTRVDRDESGGAWGRGRRRPNTRAG